MREKPILLVTSPPAKGTLEGLRRLARVYLLDDLGNEKLDGLLPSVDCLLVPNWWPGALTAGRLSTMSSLRFIQSGWAGVNHIPFKQIPKRVVVSSNAGGFSQGVAEFALALLLAAAKRLVLLDGVLRTGSFDQERWGDLVREVVDLRGKTLGVMGYGGIGRAIGSMGGALGMEVVAFSRSAESSTKVPVFQGRRGLLKLLKSSDAVVIALPLSRLTLGLLGRAELSAMKKDAILVNIARAEIVDEEALYGHLVDNPGFTYATDVWRMEDGKETYSSKFSFLKLPNFIGTPHVAGGSTARTGSPGRTAAENLEMFLKGEAPRNVVDRSEYA